MAGWGQGAAQQHHSWRHEVPALLCVEKDSLLCILSSVGAQTRIRLPSKALGASWLLDDAHSRILEVLVSPQVISRLDLVTLVPPFHLNYSVLLCWALLNSAQLSSALLGLPLQLDNSRLDSSGLYWSELNWT